MDSIRPNILFKIAEEYRRDFVDGLKTQALEFDLILEEDESIFEPQTDSQGEYLDHMGVLRGRFNLYSEFNDKIQVGYLARINMDYETIDTTLIFRFDDQRTDGYYRLIMSGFELFLNHENDMDLNGYEFIEDVEVQRYGETEEF